LIYLVAVNEQVVVLIKINSTRDEKELSRIKKELQHVLASWSSGKDEMLQLHNVRHRC
jgi:hypothetical protein